VLLLFTTVYSLYVQIRIFFVAGYQYYPFFQAIIAMVFFSFQFFIILIYVRGSQDNRFEIRSIRLCHTQVTVPIYLSHYDFYYFTYVIWLYLTLLGRDALRLL